MLQLQSCLGALAIPAIAFVFSENYRSVSWRRIVPALLLTFFLALLMLKLPALRHAFATVNSAVDAVAAATRAGTSFVFGYIGGGTLPFDPKAPGADFILAFQALPLVLVMSVLTTILFYWRWSVRSGSVARSDFRPPPIFSLAWSRRRSSSGPISTS